MNSFEVANDITESIYGMTPQEMLEKIDDLEERAYSLEREIEGLYATIDELQQGNTTAWQGRYVPID